MPTHCIFEKRGRVKPAVLVEIPKHPKNEIT
jgi:hypothetical protein